MLNFARNRSYFFQKVSNISVLCTKKKVAETNVYDVISFQIASSNQSTPSSETSVPIERESPMSVPVERTDLCTHPERKKHSTYHDAHKTVIPPASSASPSRSYAFEAISSDDIENDCKLNRYRRESLHSWMMTSMSSYFGIGVSTSSDSTVPSTSQRLKNGKEERPYILDEGSEFNVHYAVVRNAGFRHNESHPLPVHSVENHDGKMNYAMPNKNLVIIRDCAVDSVENEKIGIMNSSSLSSSISSDDTSLEDLGDTCMTDLSAKNSAVLDMMVDYGWTDQSMLYSLHKQREISR